MRGDDGAWCVFYRGSSRTERGLKHWMGLATSDDLHTCRKHGREALVSIAAAGTSRWASISGQMRPGATGGFSAKRVGTAGTC